MSVTQSEKSKAARPMAIIGLLLLLSACTTITEKGVAVSDQPAGEADLSPAGTEEGCASECGEDGVSRYQYYLGVLSIFLLG